ncbi:MAG TPA: hypothetical protein VKQ36_09650 [Ktedonobacterales bacterium]|nr:hypothetical protein [Ktedonobacterales bacterium]
MWYHQRPRWQPAAGRRVLLIWMSLGRGSAAWKAAVPQRATVARQQYTPLAQASPRRRPVGPSPLRLLLAGCLAALMRLYFVVLHEQHA